jgi:hypothetical protein
MEKVIFISVPTTCQSEKAALEAAQKAENELREIGFTNVVNPFKAGLYISDPQLKESRLKWLKKCTAVYFLNGWDECEQASNEFIFAQDKDINILFEKNKRQLSHYLEFGGTIFNFKSND